MDVIELKRVIQGLDSAVETVPELNCLAWVRYVDGYRVLTDRLLTIASGGNLEGQPANPAPEALQTDRLDHPSC